jgi:hypothetical protein
MLNEDYSDILRALVRHKVRFLVVGAYARGVQGYPRATGDFDIWVEASVVNSRKVFAALREFGASVRDIDERSFITKGIVFQIGVVPRRIDILTHIDGVVFCAAYPAAKIIRIDGHRIRFLSRPHLIRNKEKTGRPQDKVDAAKLRQL